MEWIVTLVVVGIVGWLASLVMKTDAQMGIPGNVIVGIVGASLGYWLAGTLGIAVEGPLMRWVLAVAGAALLIVILKVAGVLR